MNEISTQSTFLFKQDEGANSNFVKIREYWAIFENPSET